MDEMRECSPNPEFTLRVMKGLQGASHEGVMVTLSGSKVSAGMSLYSYYGRTNASVPEHQVMDTVGSAVRETSKSVSQTDWNVLDSYGQMKETLMLQMIPVEGDEGRLTEILHETIGDMAVVYHFDLGGNERKTSNALVTDAVRKSYDITREQLTVDVIDAAVKNHSTSLWKRQKSESRKPLFMWKTLQKAFSFPSTIYRGESR